MDTITLGMFAPEFFPVWGGTGSYIVELIKFLPRNVNVHVITLKRNIPGMSENGLMKNGISSIIDRPIEVHYVSASRETFFYNLPFQIACLRSIPSLHKKHGFDILHSHLGHMPDFLLHLFGKTCVPTVLTVHSTIQMLRDYALMAHSLFGSLEQSERYALLFYPLLRSMQRSYVRHVSRFIAVSKITEELVKEELRIPLERISLVYNGVDVSVFHPPVKNEVENKYSVPTVVYVGRMISKKGIHVLINAIPEVIRRFPQTRFLFLGGGNLPLYKEIIKRMGVPKENFSFLGHVGYFERLKVLREATVFVNPSFFENCSISILEAMSSGTAVVASDVGGNREIIKSGENGLLVPVLNSERLAGRIISLLEDENYNQEIGRNARKTVEVSFSSNKCAEETYATYKHVIGG